MPHFTVIDAPSILGLKPNGVQHLPEALKAAGLLAGLNAAYAGRVEPLPYNPQRDPCHGRWGKSRCSRWGK
jgi:arginase